MTVCATCGVELRHDGCPNKIHHAETVRLSGFVPEQRGAPSRPGPANAQVRKAIDAVSLCRVANAVSVGDVRYNQKIDYVIQDLRRLL